MKKILLLAVMALMCTTAFAQDYSKSAAKSEAKALAKAGWKGAGADAKLPDAVERSYRYMADTLNYVVGEATATGIDASEAIGRATDAAQKDALSKVKSVLKARGVKKYSTSMDFRNILAIYRQEKKGGPVEGQVRVALPLPQPKK